MITIGFSGPDDEDYNYDDLNYDDEEVVYINPESAINFSKYNPKITGKPKTIEVDAGTTIRLPCQIKHLPAELYQYVMWARLDRRNTLIASGERILSPEYQSRGKVVVDQAGSILTIAVAEDQDAGKYKCTLTLGETLQQVEHTVVVRGEPVIHSSTPAKLSLSTGDEMRLSCEISGPSSTTVRWTKKGGNLPNGLPMVETDVLVVESVTANHSGTYLCTAMDNTGRSAEKMVEVVVNYPPHVTVSEVIIHALTGDVAELICKVQGEPAPQVYWSKDGSLVGTDKRISTRKEDTRHYLTIKQVQEEDLDMYTCSAKNSQGMGHKDITLTASSAIIHFESFSLHLLFLLSILASVNFNMHT